MFEVEGDRIASQAVKLAKHSGRRTVHSGDIKLAITYNVTHIHNSQGVVIDSKECTN